MSAPKDHRTGEDEEFDYVCLDENGDAIPSNAEASIAVALTFGDELMTHDATDEWYMDGMRECEEMRSRLLALDIEGSDEAGDDDSDSDECTTDDPTSTTVDEDLGEEGGMEGSWSREYSDQPGDDDWVLERILKRRAVHDHERVYDDDGNVEVRAAFEYLCKWKWYREPTWEARCALEEMGLVPQLDAFDELRRPQPRTSNRRVERAPKRKEIPLGTLETLMGDGFEQKVLSKFAGQYSYITRYAPVLNKSCEERFIREWKAHSTSHCPMILFHGTRVENLSSIASMGLVVPSPTGQVRVAHGSAYGVGIYAAKNANYSMSYTEGCNKMFVCLGLVGPQYTTMKECGDICVFFDAAAIVPLWLVEYTHIHPGPPHRVELRSMLHPRRNVAPMPPIAAGPPASNTKHLRMTKKMIKQQPRSVKELYKAGSLLAKKT